MTPAELEDKQIAQQKALAEKHISQWKDLNIDFEKQMLKTGDTPEFQAKKLERIAAFTIQMGKDNRDLVTTQTLEHQRLSHSLDSIRALEANSAGQVNEERESMRKRVEQQKAQRQQVSEEHKTYMTEVANDERHEQYNQSNIASDAPTELTSQKRQEIEQTSIETERDIQKRLRAERILSTLNKDKDNGR